MLTQILVPVVASLLVGLGSSYIATQIQQAKLQGRVNRLEEEVARFNDVIGKVKEEINKNTHTAVRVETKLDLLLQSRGIDSEN